MELIAEQGITTLHFVPSMLRVFLEEEGVEECALAVAGDLQRGGVAAGSDASASSRVWAPSCTTCTVRPKRRWT